MREEGWAWREALETEMWEDRRGRGGTAKWTLMGNNSGKGCSWGAARPDADIKAERLRVLTLVGPLASI